MPRVDLRSEDGLLEKGLEGRCSELGEKGEEENEKNRFHVEIIYLRNKG